MSIDNRKQLRLNVARDVVINDTLKVRGLDLSEGGIYVHTGRAFPSGTFISLALPLKDKVLRLKAKVQHSQAGVGMGLMFVEMTEEQKQTIKDYLVETLSKPAETTKKKILLVDDMDSARRMNKSKLVLEGFAVVEARDGLEALTLLNSEMVDAIVLDLYMDKMDGFKTLTFLRQSPEFAEVPILVLSARSTPDEIDKAMFAGATEFLPKMMTSPAKLCEKLKSLLK